MSNFILLSDAFYSDGKKFQEKYGYKFENQSPPLKILVVFLKIHRLLLLIMDDPDAMGAVGKVWVHWLVLVEY